MQTNDFEKVIIWGLLSVRHSHRFIHKSFFDNFSHFCEDVSWVDDKIGQDYSSYKKTLFLVSGMASKHFPILRNASYVFHNVELSNLQVQLLEKNKCNYINLQVFTKDARGVSVWDSPYIVLDSKNRCLYQPWGTPIEFENWQTNVSRERTKIEYWIGAIWNNALLQGNSEIIDSYKNALKLNGIKFKRIGGSRLFISGVGDEKAVKLTRKSSLGSVIVGNWQKENNYVPCRLFKNLSAGVPPIINFDLKHLLGESQLYNDDVFELVRTALEETDISRQLRLESAQLRLRQFTYKDSISRIMQSLEMTRRS
jgi:hypothetical protein